MFFNRRTMIVGSLLGFQSSSVLPGPPLAALPMDIGRDVAVIRTSGHYRAGDGGGARYVRAAARPSHQAAFRSADGSWWEIAESIIDVRMLGAVWEPRRDNTAAIQASLDCAVATRARGVELPEGESQISGLVVGDSIELFGAGVGRTVLRLLPAANRHMIFAPAATKGRGGLVLRGFSLDGRAAQQTAVVHGVLLEGRVNPLMEISVQDCRASGIVLAGGRGGAALARNACRGNGRYTAGYGLYCYNHDAAAIRGFYDDNCIGVAVEASGRGATARDVTVSVQATGNRMDFGQSGAGVHWEQSDGGDAGGGLATDCVCENGTGVGFNNTGTNLRIEGGAARQNAMAGISTSAATGFVYADVEVTGNGRREGPGYQAAVRFDDTDSLPGSSGVVRRLRVRGPTPNAFRTLSKHGAVLLENNDVAGFTAPFSTRSPRDRIR